MPVLKVSVLKKVFSGNPPFVAVDGISFHLDEGEILGILGANGAGKTTTLQMLLGVLTYSSGKIEYFGKDFKNFRSEILEKVSFASAYVGMPSMLTVEQSLRIFCKLYGIPGEQIPGRIDEYLKIFGVFQKKKALAGTLSAGQTTRMMLAKAFMTEPKVLLLDEPTASLDPDIAQDVLELILKVRKEKKLSILFTSHNMAEISQICDRILFMQGGKIVADDTPQKLANSVKGLSLELIIVDGLKRAQAIADSMKLRSLVEHRKIAIELPSETDIANYLQKLATEKVIYSGIQLVKPTLEDYFMAMTKKRK